MIPAASLAGSEIVCQFTVRPDEYAAAMTLLSRKRLYRTAQRSLARQALVFAAAFAIGIGLVWLPTALGTSGFIGTMDVDSVVTGVILSAICFSLLLGIGIRLMNARLVKNSGQYLAGDLVELTAGQEGLSFVTRSKTIILNYAGIDEVLSVAKGMLVCSGLLGHYVPDAAFGSDEKRQKFIALLRQRLPGGAVAQSEILHSHGVLQ